MRICDLVIVNWNAGPQLRACVDSVLEHDEGRVKRIIVVDNASSDRSADNIDGLPRVHVIRARENLGFAAACNLGAAAGDAPYVLFLNPDTRLFMHSLSAPLAFMEQRENRDVGICGIQLLDENGEVSRSCARFPSLSRLMAGAVGLDKLPAMRGAAMQLAEWDHAETREVDQVIGAFFMIRRALFERLGGFDERFFVYFEEVDLSLRARQLGQRTVYLTEARAFHAGGGTSRQVKAHRLFYFLRSRLLYGFKHFHRGQAWTLTGVTCLVEPFTRTVYCVMRRDWDGVHNTWAAYRMLWAGIGRIVRGEGRFPP